MNDDIYKKYNFIPEIDKNLPEKDYNHRNKYRRLYIRLIERCKNMTEEELSGYNEKHHILPRCMGGNDNKDNLVKMPIRYHIMAHIVLVEIYPNNYKLNYALHLIFYNTKSKIKTVIDKHFSTKTISKIREKSVKNRSGDNHPRYGKHISEERKQDFKKDLIGSKNFRANKIISPTGVIYGSVIEASRTLDIPYSTLTKWLSGEVSNHGWRYYGKKTDFSNRSVEKSSKKVVSPEGILYKSIKDASLECNIAYTTLRYWLSGRVKNKHGWSYYNESQSD